MNIRINRHCVSLLALTTAAFLVIQPAVARADSTSRLQSELNNLQAQINALKSQQSALNAQQAQLKYQAHQQNVIAEEQATVTKQQQVFAKQQLLASSGNEWYASGNKAVPEFETRDGKSAFTIGGQIEVDAGLGTVPHQRGFSGGTAFRRIELSVEGVYDEHYLWKVEEDFTKTSTPLGGVLDAFFGYQNKFGKVHNVFLVGNQHTPFGFQTASEATLYMENEMGNSLFQDNRQLGVTGQTYTDHWNAWYGVTGTNNGTQSSAATSTTTINTGTTVFNSQYTGSAVVAWTPVNTPGHLVSIRNSLEYNRYNGNLDAANEPSFSAVPGLNVYGTKFINTGALPIQSALVESPRLDFEDNRLSLAAVYYDTTTQSNSTFVAAPRVNRRVQPKFSAWDLEAQYFLTNDHEPYSTYHGYYVAVNPTHPVSKGGLGAIQLTARLDEANLNDNSYNVHGGNETNLTLGVNWWPTRATRVNINYVKVFPIGGTAALTPATSLRGRSASIVAVRLEFIY